VVSLVLKVSPLWAWWNQMMYCNFLTSMTFFTFVPTRAFKKTLSACISLFKCVWELVKVSMNDLMMDRLGNACLSWEECCHVITVLALPLINHLIIG
jgi:hypothetical protein